MSLTISPNWQTPIDHLSLNGPRLVQTEPLPNSARYPLPPVEQEIVKLRQVLKNPTESGLLELYRGDKVVLDHFMKDTNGTTFNLKKLTPEQEERLVQGFFSMRQKIILDTALQQATNGAPFADLKNLTPEQEQRFVSLFVEYQNIEGNNLAQLPPEIQHFGKRGFRVLVFMLESIIANEFIKMRSFAGTENPYLTLAEKFRVAINVTNKDFANGDVTSISDLNDPNHKYRGYREVTKYNPLVTLTGVDVVRVLFTPDGDGKPKAAPVYSTDDPSNTTRASNEYGVSVINDLNVWKYETDSNPNLSPQELKNYKDWLGVNEASHYFFLAQFPYLNRTNLKPLQRYPGDSFIQGMSANQVWEFFSDVSSAATVDPTKTIESCINSREFPQYALSEYITTNFLKNSGFTQQDVEEIKQAKGNFKDTFEAVCRRLGHSPTELGNRYREEMLKQGNAINDYLKNNPDAFNSAKLRAYPRHSSFV